MNISKLYTETLNMSDLGASLSQEMLRKISQVRMLYGGRWYHNHFVLWFSGAPGGKNKNIFGKNWSR